MLKPFPFRLAAFLIAAALAIAVIASWRADRHDRAELAADLAAANQSLAQATIRQHDRDAQLTQTLSVIAAQKRVVTTPAQILRDLPNRLPLPIPITLPTACAGDVHQGHPQVAQLLMAAPRNEGAEQRNVRAPSLGEPCSSGTPSVPEGFDSTSPATKTPSTTSPNSGGPSATDSAAPAFLPTADLKPLYDFALDCQACQAKLSAAQSDLADERAKTSTLTRERNEAIHATKGGSTFRRLTRAAKWFALGAAAGAIAATAHH